ncbi:MAG: hypothetical protein KAI24_23130, partial [Planctomycetes bacterium]|nr:hypothetical protein [Planctomycetota bacterium]
MFRQLSYLFSGLLLLTSCSSSGSDGTADAQAGGRVAVVVDTRAGEDALVQFEVAGVTLERVDGTQTANLLAEPTLVTFGDPAGEPFGLTLSRTPPGPFVALNLAITPASGIAITATETFPAVTAPLLVRVPIESNLAHDGAGDSWLVIAHQQVPLQIGAGSAVWSPDLVGRDTGEPVDFEQLTAPVVRNDRLFLTAFGDRSLACVTDQDTEYFDRDGNQTDRQAFLDGLIPEDVFCARGALRRDGTYDLRRIERCQRQVRPRLIGHVQSVDAVEQSFVLRVQAANGPFGALLVQTPEDIRVFAGNARVERPNGSVVGFAAITPGRLAKLRWSSRDTNTGGLPAYIAEKVEVPGPGSGMPVRQWRGVVASVDLANGVLVLEPSDGQLVVQGQA